MNDMTPLTHTYNAWALVKDGKYITTSDGQTVLYDRREIAHWDNDCPGATVVRVEVTVRAV